MNVYVKITEYILLRFFKIYFYRFYGKFTVSFEVHKYNQLLIDGISVRKYVLFNKSRFLVISFRLKSDRDRFTKIDTLTMFTTAGSFVSE